MGDVSILETVDWLVWTKLQPPILRADVVQRPRLLNTLRAVILTRPVTLISAPAGYGKSTLLASLPQVMPEMRQAWISLDAEENDPSRLLTALIGALQRLHPGCGERARAQLAADPRQVMGLLINEVLESLPEPFLLVLDDLHVLTEPRVYLALEYLIDHLPPQMRLVIATRHDPPLPLARLAARRQLGEIRQAHLSFTPEEAAQLLNEVLALHLTEAELARLQARTEGWAAGLCLLASTLELESPEGRSALLNGLVETDRYLFEYLADEVLGRQPPEIRTFLLQTAILTDLTPAMCHAVTGRPDSQAVLEGLYRRNLFLIRDQAGTYRYHALFTEFLRETLQREMPASLPDLHRRAAAVQPSPLRAIHHYLAAGLWEEAAQAIGQVGEQALLMGMMESLRAWGEAMPADVRERHPYLLLLMARSAIQRGAPGEAAAMAARAQALYAAAGEAGPEGAALATRIIAVGLLDDFPALRPLVAEALSPARAGDLRLRATVLPARIWLDLIDQQWEQGRNDLAESIDLALGLRDLNLIASLSYSTGPLFGSVPGALPLLERFAAEAGALIPRGDNPPQMALAELRTFLHLMRGQLEEALSTGQAAVALKERLGGFAWLGVYALVYLATLQAVRGERAEAERCLALMAQSMGRGPIAQRPLWLYGAARTHWVLDHPDQTRRLLEQLRSLPSGAGFQPEPLIPRLTGLLALSEGRLADAEAAFAEAVAWEAKVPLVLAVGSARALLARALLERNRPDEALAALRPALALAEERGMPGILLQEGHLALPALRLAAAAGDAMAVRVVALLNPPASQASPPAASPSQATPPQATPELLTPREREVLRLMAGGGSNREIAEALIVGEETVKTHVARILRKLDATTRTQAAARGRELGLI